MVGVPWSVSLSLLLNTLVIPAKVAELIEMLFGVCTRAGPRNHVLGSGPDPLVGRDTFGSNTLACLELPAVNKVICC